VNATQKVFESEDGALVLLAQGTLSLGIIHSGTPSRVFTVELRQLRALPGEHCLTGACPLLQVCNATRWLARRPRPPSAPPLAQLMPTVLLLEHFSLGETA